MTDYASAAAALVAQLSLEEKCSLLSGHDFWHTEPVARVGLESVMVTDGPHGVRQQDETTGDHLGLNQSVAATCFPTASASACSFDPALLREMGAAIGEECREQNVSVLLGPGVNMKRSPLCGRNFEYFSEDPLLAGELAAAFIAGVQSQGVGTSLKHYAANNQETRRMSIDAVADERTLRELYLAGFERAVTKGKPWTVMCSYNRVWGTLASENKRLLTDVLRGEWGFEGLVMSDWGATGDRVTGVKAGLDLQMPGPAAEADAGVLAAVRAGTLSAAEADTAVARVVEMVLKARDRQPLTYDREAHQALARRIAAESAVLAKNEGVLPLKPGASLAVIGAMAETPRYQGAGSSQINPSRLESLAGALRDRAVEFAYAPGYTLDDAGENPDEALIAEAVAAAEGKDAVIVVAGLPASYESEGFDRTTLAMPPSHVRLIEAVAAANPRTAVVLQLGAPASVPWADHVAAVLIAYLGGQAGGPGVADVLFGDVNPSGKLAETWPAALADVPSTQWFPGGTKTVEYREGLFAGYRYFATAKVPVVWPFGHGLSYTQFDYSDLTLSAASWSGGPLTVSVTVKNTGAVAGAETVQVYAGHVGSSIPRPVRELRGFAKVFLTPGEARTVTVELDDRSFSYWNEPAKAWAVEGGAYRIEVGASSADIKLEAALEVAGDGREALLAELAVAAPEYSHPAAPFKVPDASFQALLGRPVPPAERVPGEQYTVNSTLGDIKDTFIGKIILKQVQANAKAMTAGMTEESQKMVEVMMKDMPLRAVGMMSNGAMTAAMIDGVVDAANGHLLRGFLKLAKGRPKKK